MADDHYFYLARCRDGSLYAGTCIDVAGREAMHNSGKGAKYTRSRRPVMIIYHEKLASLGDARRREAAVKRWPKARKEELVRPVTSRARTAASGTRPAVRRAVRRRPSPR